MSVHCEPPIELVSDGAAYTPVLGTYTPQTHRPAWLVVTLGCGGYALFIAAIAGLAMLLETYVPSLAFLAHEGVADLAGGLLGLGLAVLIGLFVIARRWWSRAELDLDEIGLHHGDWTLPWERVIDIDTDRLRWTSESRSFPSLILSESDDVAWGLPTRTFADAEALAEQVRLARGSFRAAAEIASSSVGAERQREQPPPGSQSKLTTPTQS